MRWQKVIVAICFVLTLLGAGRVCCAAPAQTSQAANDQRAPEVVDRIARLFSAKSSIATVQMQIKNENGQRDISMKIWSLGDKLLAPHHQVLQGSGHRRPQRRQRRLVLPAENQSHGQSPGLDVDERMDGQRLLDRRSGERDLSHARLHHQHLFSGKPRRHRVDEYTLTPKPDAPVVWGKIILQIRQRRSMPTWQGFYDEDGKLVRELTFSDYKSMSGRLIPTRLVMQPADKAGPQTTIEYEDIAFDVPISGNTFSAAQSETMSGRLLQLAWRNLWRNRRRTFITMAAIAFGYVMLLFVACLMAGLRWQMIENGTSPGHVSDPGACSRLLSQPLHSKDSRRKQRHGCRRVARRHHRRSPRLRRGAQGLRLRLAQRRPSLRRRRADGDRSRPGTKVTILNKQLVKGSYLTARAPKSVVIGDKLASTIGIELGSEMFC